MAFVLSQSVALSFLNFVILHGEKFKVEARPKEVIPVPGWFNNVEGFVLPNFKALQSTEPSYINKDIETNELLNAVKRKMNNRNRKKMVKKVAKKHQEEDRRKSNNRGNAKTKKHKSRRRRLKFVKSDINNDIRDSNLSQSKERQSERKPVDIIVHIKMNE